MRRLEKFCWLTGIVLLSLFCAIRIQAHVFQEREGAELNRRILSNKPPTPADKRGFILQQTESAATPLVGRLEIPSLKVTSIIEEGDDARTLRNGVGHIPGTAIPGEGGNVGLAGHRDTFFRALANLKEGDVIALTTPRGTFHYRVETTGIVPPDQTSILRPVGLPTLTLVTCYPFYYVGPAPNRYVVSAFLVDQTATNQLILPNRRESRSLEGVDQ